MHELLLGIDIGSGSTKAVVADADGEIVATATRPHEVMLPRHGWAEMDAETMWWGETASLTRELSARVGPDRIAGICVSGVGPCLLVCDDNVQPLRPAILYGIDMRAGAEITELTRRYGAAAIVERGGSALSTQAVGPKMLWLQRNEPDTWARTRRWYNSNSFVGARLTGEYFLDHHTASQCDPMYDIHSFRWFDEWAGDIAPGLEFPRLIWPSDVAGRVTAAAAAETGLRAGTPVSAGTVDAWSEAFSVGVRRPGELMMMYGSTAFFVNVMRDLHSDPVLWTTAGIEPGTYTFAAGTSAAGSLTTWIRNMTGSPSFEQMVAEAAATPAGSDGLLLLPYFQGERTPIYDPRARGVLAGLSLRHERGHLYRAVYEGIAFGLRHVLEFFDQAGGKADRIVAVGGGTTAELWTQIVTDVTGREQHIPSQTIGASYGDALLAAIGTGLVSPGTDWSKAGRTVVPDDRAHALYERMYQDFLALYPATKGNVHRLASLQEAADSA